MNNICYVRMLNASPNSPALDVYINDVLFVQDLKYKDFTQYFKGELGEYNIKIYKAGDKEDIILQRNIELYLNNIYTIAIMGIYNVNGLELNLIGDHQRNIDKNYSYIRFINLSPSSQELDIILNEELVISDLSYGTESSYLKMTPGNYNFKAFSKIDERLVLENPNLILKADKIYSGYIVGLYTEKINTMQILLPLEGATYLKF